MYSDGGIDNETVDNCNMTIDTFPKQFLVWMKTLFDIMDDHMTGFVKLSDIENGWQDDGTKNIPHNVIDCLRKVSPPNGLLSFERFCAGLKLSLICNQIKSNNNSDLLEAQSKISKPLDFENDISSNWSSNPKIHSNNVTTNQRALSLPQLNLENHYDIMPDMPMTKMLSSPPKPPRTELHSNWHIGTNNKVNVEHKRGAGDGGSTEMCYMMHQQSLQKSLDDVFQNKANSRKSETRRHTLQNGIDYNMLKRLKQYEEEKDILLDGLAAVEQAKDWYLEQIANVQEKIKHLGNMGSHVEQWSKSQQDHRDLQRARVVAVNRCLSALVNTWERDDLSLHIDFGVKNKSVGNI